MRLALLFCAAAALAQDGLYQFAVDQDRLSGAPDFSFLNRPLTPADRVVVRGEHFYRAGDGARVRFFGINSVFGGCFPEEADAPRIAKRLRRLDINLVRLHHMDSSPDSDPQQARSILTTGPYPTLNTVSLPRLRKYIDALAAEGIYVNVNLHVGYVFRPEVDKIPAMPEGQRFPEQSKPLHIFHPRMVELQIEYTRKLLEALKLKGDPGLAMIEIDNETSLVQAWQSGGLERAVQGEYKTELQKQWNTFLRAVYKSAPILRRAWGSLPEGQTVEAGDIPLVGFKEEGPQRRTDDFLMFLVDRDRDYLRRMRAAAHAATDSRVPVAGTQMGFGGLLNLDSHAVLDYQDNHFYTDHYNFPNQRWDARDWRIRDASTVGSGLAVYLNMAAAREAGRPYTVSEYNQNWPNRQAAEIDPTLAAFGAFQDWDSIMHFAYSHGRAWDSKVPSGFDLNSDWTKWVNFGQAALLFRTAIAPARQAVAIPAPLELRLRATRERRGGAIATALNTAIGYDPAVALLHRVALAKKEGAAPRPAGQANVFRSDTGELVYDRERKLLLVQSPTAAGVFGFIDKEKATAGAIDVELAPSARGFATVLLTALDQRPVAESARLLLTTPGYTLGSQPNSDPPRPQRFINYGGAPDWWTIEPEPNSGKPSGSRNGGVPPVWMERVESYVTVRSAGKRISVYPLDGAGARLKPLDAAAIQRVGGGFRIHLQAEGQAFAPWYELEVAR